MLPSQTVHHRLEYWRGGSGLSAGGLEELQGAQEVPAVARLCHHHTEELERLLPSQISSSTHGSNSLERIQGEKTLLSDVQDCDAAAGNGQGIPGSTHVSERVKPWAGLWLVRFLRWFLILILILKKHLTVLVIFYKLKGNLVKQRFAIILFLFCFPKNFLIFSCCERTMHAVK